MRASQSSKDTISTFQTIFALYVFYRHAYRTDLSSCIAGDRPLKLGKNCDFLNKSFPCKGLALCLLHTWTGAVTRTKDDEDNNEKLTILKGVADQPWFGFPL